MSKDASSDPSSPGGYRIEVSPDGCAATLVLAAGEAVKLTDLLTQMRAMKFADVDDEVVREGLSTRSGEEPFEAVIARGTPPVDERPGKFELRVPLPEGPAFTLTRVEAGQLIATIGQGTPGTEGRDVFGAPVPPGPGPAPYKLGAGLLSAKGEVSATARGSLRVEAGTLAVSALLSAGGDEKSPVQFEGDVAVRGSVKDGLTVRASGWLLVGGTVEGAEVQVGGSAHVKCGIIGKNKARLQVGRDLFCRYASGAEIHAVGDVHVAGEMLRSRVVCGGRVTIGRGPLAGGHIAANGGISTAVLGNEAGLATVVEAGLARIPNLLVADGASRVEAARKRVAEIRGKIAPLLQIMKSLTPLQRERVTELLSEASDLEEQANATSAEVEARRAELAARTLPEIVVGEVAHAGVLVRLPGAETLITTAMQGPFRLTVRKVGNVSQVVLLDDATGKATPLPPAPMAKAA